MIVTNSNPAPPYVVLRKNGSDYKIPFPLTETESGYKYLAARLGGQNRYSKLLASYNASSQSWNSNTLSDFRVNISGQMVSPQKITNDYGNSTVDLAAYYDGSCDGQIIYPYTSENISGGDEYDPETWSTPGSSTTWDLDVSAEILAQDERNSTIIGVHTDTETTHSYWESNRSLEELGCFTAGTTCLIHYSECKVANPSPEIAAKKGQWEIVKIADVFEGNSDYLPDMLVLALYSSPVLDLENFHIQIVPFLDLKALTVCTGLTIKPAPYGTDSNGTKHGGIVALRCCGYHSRPTSQYNIQAVALEFLGGQIDMRSANLPDNNDGVFIFTPTYTVYNSKYSSPSDFILT